MLTLADIATLAERSLKKNGYVDPIFFFEGTKDIQTREFPNLPEKALLESLEALGFIFAYTDQIGELVHIFFMCEAWFNRNASIRAVDDPRRFEGVFLYQRDMRSGTWDVAEYKILRNNGGRPLELQPVKSPETVFNDVTIGNVVDSFLRGFRRGLVKKKVGL
jgi:hypothetical protein